MLTSDEMFRKIGVEGIRYIRLQAITDDKLPPIQKQLVISCCDLLLRYSGAVTD